MAEDKKSETNRKTNPNNIPPTGDETHRNLKIV
jgi:hypothetical protein